MAMQPAASRASPPHLRIAGDPSVYLLHVSDSPRFAEGATIVSKVATPEELGTAWRRSLSALADAGDRASETDAGPVYISVAVRTVAQDHPRSIRSTLLERGETR